jgi:hypothetical protein
VSPTRFIRFSRLRLLALTALDLGLVALAALGIQDGRPLLAAPSYMLLVLSAAALLLLCREWFSPSRIEMSPDSISIKWNNWRIRGARLAAEMTKARPRSLVLSLGRPEYSVDPVGPLHLGAMLVIRPLLGLFLPRHLSRTYFIDSRRLSGLLGRGPGEEAVVAFPVCLFGKRRIRHALEKYLE